MPATTAEKIKASVRERYTRAVTEKDQGCCDTSCCAGTVEGDVVASAGYRPEELSTLPADAIGHRFGCGNPLAFAGVEPGQTVVDIGSGAGIDCLLAAQRVGTRGRVIGVDMTPIMIEKARANARAAGLNNVEFRLGEAEAMPIESGTADWIISNCVINLSPDKPLVFREAFRVLKPGGRLSITDIMVERLPWILRQSTRLYSACVSGAISEAEYVEGLRRAGFENVQVTERIVYDRGHIQSLIAGTLLPRPLNWLFRGPLRVLIDRYVVGRIWSAKVAAHKPD